MLLGVFFMGVSSSWLGVWVGLELNLFGFLPLMTDMKNTKTLEASLKYFLIQAFGSSLFLAGVLLGSFWNSVSIMLILLAISVKMALPPFYFWLPSVMSSLSWKNCILLNTVQKMGPIFLFAKFCPPTSLVFLMIMSSGLLGATLGMAQAQVRAIMAYSSMVHLSWMLALGMYDFYSLIKYLSLYFFLSSLIFLFCLKNNLSRLSFSSSKIFPLLFTFLSLGGLPPLTGFYMKWVGISVMASMGSFFLMALLIFSSALSLYFYLTLLFTWFSSFQKKKMLCKEDLLFIFCSSFGLPILLYAMIFFDKP